MSPALDNLAKVRRWFDALGRLGVDGVLPIIDETCDPDVEFSPMIGRELEGRPPSKGRAAVRAYFEELSSLFSDFRFEAKDVEVVSGDVIAVTSRALGSGKESDAPVVQAFTAVFEFRDGLISRCVSYGSHDEAMKAAAEAVEVA